VMRFLQQRAEFVGERRLAYAVRADEREFQNSSWGESHFVSNTVSVDSRTRASDVEVVFDLRGE
jgi:hypothetical protein